MFEGKPKQTLEVEYCFRNEVARCGFTKGHITMERNPRKVVEFEVERILKVAEEKEKNPVIFIGYVLY